MRYFLIMISFILFALTFQSCSWNKTMKKNDITAPVSPIAPFTKNTLDNGLEVIVKEVHSAPIVAVYLWCRTGSANETEKEYGISHFYEHMFFKGTEKRGVGEIDRAIKSIGGYNNAFTSKEYTAYYVVLPSENFSFAADVLLDAIRNSKFPDDEITKELGVIKEEINRKEDDPSDLLYEELFSVMFPGTPYAHSVLGTKESISGITRDDFKNYLNKYYVPNNMTAVVVGDIKTADVLKEFKKLTSDWKPSEKINAPASVNIPVKKGISGFTIEKDVNMSYVMLAFRTTGLSDRKENAALDILSSILGEGRSSRLYKRLVEKERIASSANAFIYPLNHAGIFAVFGTMDKENVQKFKNAVIEEISKLRKEPPSPEELQKVKTMLKADYQFSNETDSDIAQTLGQYNTMNMLNQVTEYEKNIDAITTQEVIEYANKIFQPESYTIGIINQRIPSAKEVTGE